MTPDDADPPAAGGPPRVLALDAAAWRTAADVYAALLAALGAPAWHGRNLDALNDSLTSEDINGVNAPLRVDVQGLAQAGPEAQHTAARIARVFADLEGEGHAVAWRAVGAEGSAPAI